MDRLKGIYTREYAFELSRILILKKALENRGFRLEINHKLSFLIFGRDETVAEIKLNLLDGEYFVLIQKEDELDIGVTTSWEELKLWAYNWVNDPETELPSTLPNHHIKQN